MTIEEQIQENRVQISEFAHLYAAENGIRLAEVIFDDGRTVGIKDLHMIRFSAREHNVVTKLTHIQIERYTDEDSSDMTRSKIRSAIDRLKLLLEE